MKKKILLSVTVFFLLIGLVGCNNKTNEEFEHYETSSYVVEEKYDGKCMFLTSMEDYKNKCPELTFSGIELTEEFFKDHNAFVAYAVVSQGNIEFTVDSCNVNENDNSKLDVVGKLFSKGEIGTEAIESRSILVVTDKNIKDVNFSCK